MDFIITILPVVTKDLPISPRFTLYNFYRDVSSALLQLVNFTVAPDKPSQRCCVVRVLIIPPGQRCRWLSSHRSAVVLAILPTTQPILSSSTLPRPQPSPSEDATSGEDVLASQRPSSSPCVVQLSTQFDRRRREVLDEGDLQLFGSSLQHISGFDRRR